MALVDLGGTQVRTLQTGPNSFIFTYIHSSPSQREILDPPLYGTLLREIISKSSACSMDTEIIFKSHLPIKL